MSHTCLAIILAAGDSKRMKSSRSKVLHEVGGLPLISHIVLTALNAEIDHVALVLGRNAETIMTTVTQTTQTSRASKSISTHLQHQRMGTAHAVLQARDEIAKGYDHVLVLVGDAPLIRQEILHTLRAELVAGADVVVAGFDTENPFGYGRMISKNGELIAIVEEKDASDKQRKISFCNGGLIAINGKIALDMIDMIDNKNAKGEYYLTDIVEVCQNLGKKSVAINVPETDLMGCNTRVELAIIETQWQKRKRQQMMLSGVSMMNPETVYLSYDTRIAPDVTIEPNVWFGPGVIIEQGATILAFSHIEGAHIGANTSIGPFARLRPGTTLSEHVKIGNFCEIKKVTVGKGSKINHLSYIGDCVLGEGVNIGAGTITCNYDGYNKHFTEIGDNSFIGSNSSLIAPVKIGSGAFVGSGSVLNKDVPDNDLALTRVPQMNIENAAIKIRSKNAALKEKRKKA